MKKLYILLIIGLFAGFKSYAQNTFNSSGDATLNTTVPAGHGSGYNALWMPNGTALMPENSTDYAGIFLTSNILRTTNNQWGFVNSSLPAWRLVLGHGPVTNGFAIQRSAPGSYSEQTLFKINNAGNVGIGTATPQSFTEIRKDVRNGVGPVLELTNGGGYDGASSEIYFSTYQRDGANPSARIKVADDADWGGNIYFDTKGTDPNAPLYTRMFIDGTEGKIGIGTTIPNAKLDVQGALLTGSGQANLDPSVTNLNFLANSAQMVTGWNRSAGRGEADFINNQGNGDTGGFAFYNHNNSNQETKLMWIRGDGDVVIGSNIAQGKLDVNGTIHTQSVNVDMNGWSDYVFKHAYRLRPLAEVKAYIEENHHLPDVPSEQEVLKEGVNLGEMNKILLRKVEELTLYLIKHNKQMHNIQTQNMRTQETLQSQINQLKLKVSRTTRH